MKTVVLLILIYVFCGFCSVSLAQEVKIYGQISESDGTGIPYARIDVLELKQGAESDSTGKYVITLNSVPASELTLTVSATLYLPTKFKIQLKQTEIRKDIQLLPDPKSVHEVVITGTLKESFKADSPIPVETYSMRFFEKTNNSNIFESLQMVNGVQSTLNCAVCATGDIHINGMEGPYTMVTIDGMPIVSGLSTVYGLAGIPNSMISRVEVVKGSAGALYGSEAVGGLINIITKKPGEAPRLSVNGWVSSYLENNLDVGTAFKVGKKTHTLISANGFWFNTRFDKNNDNFTDVTLQKRVSLFNKWTFERKYNREGTFAIRYFAEDRFGGEMNWQPVHRGGEQIYGESIYTHRIEFLSAYQLPLKKEKIKLQLSYNWHDQNSVYGSVPYLGRQSVGFAQLIWDKKIKKHDLLLGIACRYNYYDDNTPATFDSLTGNRASVFGLPGVFLQDEYVFGKKWKLLGGLRYDYHTIHKNIFSPRLSFMYRPNTSITFRLTGGNGFRVVNVFTEDHAALTGSRRVIFKENLAPERSWNVNLNYNHLITFSEGYFSIDASAFYYHFFNKIIGDYFTNSDAVIYKNLKGYALSRGFSLNTEFQFRFPLKFQAGITLMQVFISEPDSSGNEHKIPQVFTPSVMGTFALSYKFQKLGLTADLNGQIYGPMHLPVLENDFRPAESSLFCILNAQITKKLKKGFEIYVGVKNLLDFIPKNPLMRPFDPFDRRTDENNPNGYTFDTSYGYAPMFRRHFFAGFRFRLP